MPNLQHQLLSTTDPGNLEQTPHKRCQPLPAPDKQLIHDINITNERHGTT